MAHVFLCVELRPLLDGEWEIEDRRATYEGDVEVTFRHPNPRSRTQPRRARLPMIYTMHIPPHFVRRPDSPPPRRASPRPRGFRLHPSRPRVRRRVQFSGTPTYTPGTDAEREEEEEDPEEDPSEGPSTGWRTGDAADSDAGLD